VKTVYSGGTTRRGGGNPCPMPSAHARSGLRRAALLLAALLHVWVVGVGPLLHDLRTAPPAAGWMASHDEQAVAAHDELSCLLCQAMAGPALPAAAGSLAVLAPHSGAPAPASALPQPFRAASPTRARAPPVPTA